MADDELRLPPPMELPPPNYEGLDPKAPWQVRFDKKADVLFLHIEKPRPAMSIDLDGDMWLRMDPRTGEVVGFQIDDFERVFLPAHPELGAAWHQLEPSASGQFELPNWLRILFDFLRRHFGDHHPNQRPLLRPH